MRDIEARAGYPDDDDLTQAVILAAACHDAEALDADGLTRRFWVWGEENGLGMGHATRATLARYGGSAPRCYGSRKVSARPFQAAREPVGLPALEASRAAWEDAGGKAAGNGAVMRCAPLAIRWRQDDAALVRNTVVSAVAGAVLGAWFGLDAIPKRWRDRVAKLRADRVAMEVWAGRLTGVKL